MCQYSIQGLYGIRCILAYLHPIEKNDQGGSIVSDRVSKYEPFKNELDFTGITFPVSIHQIPKFEKQNDISVSVFSFEDSGEKGEFGIVYIP